MSLKKSKSKGKQPSSSRVKKNVVSRPRRIQSLSDYLLARQKTNFVGGLSFDRQRSPLVAVTLIASRCLKARYPQTAASDRLLEVCLRLGISFDEVSRLAASCWPIDRAAGDRLHEILKGVGYGGTLDDLWLSIYGRIKPSVSIGTQRSGAEWRPNPIPITGQTRKPGSHKG